MYTMPIPTKSPNCASLADIYGMANLLTQFHTHEAPAFSVAIFQFLPPFEHLPQTILTEHTQRLLA
jgi:hypothetical protein